MKPKVKFTIILVAEFVAIAVLLLLVFFAGKRSYDVTFDLNGGTLISGSVSQRVTQGQDANPPAVVKEGHYLRGWSGSYKGITSDRVVKAIWEYETTPGIMYSEAENQNFCEIVGCYPEVNGDVYIGAYHNDIQVLGITDGAFKSLDKITAVYLLDGILKIGNETFKECASLETIDLPSTLVRIGDSAFAECESLTEINLPEGLLYIGTGAFKNCTSLERIVLPSTLKKISVSAFEGCTSLREVVFADTERELEPEDVEDNGSINFDDLFGSHDDETPIMIPVPSSITQICARAFFGCSSLERVVLPSEIKTVRADAFANCKSLSEVVIPKTLTHIEPSAFTSPDTVFLIMMPESEKPLGWENGWCASDSFTWDYVLPEAPDVTDSESTAK
ncbi:MAG: leucine-rich repeat protein [Clostridia bacterium]|nr:leucine-rich repeat protein [Clostridia bacterium]